MAVTCKMYGKAINSIMNKEISWASDTIKCALVSSTPSFDQDNLDYFNDITDELSASGNYTSGGATLASKTSSYNSSTNVYSYDCADISWTTATFTARGAIIYDSTGVASTSPLICYIDFGEDKSVSSSTFTIVLDSNGLFKFTVS